MTEADSQMSSWEGCLSNDERQWDTMKTSTIYACARWRVSFPPPTREVFFLFFFFHLMPLSPLPALPPIPHMVPHPYLSLRSAAHSFFLSHLFSFLLCLLVYFNFRQSPRCLSFIPPLCSLLGSGYLEALWPTGIKAFQLHLQSQNKNKTAGFCSPQW